MRLSYSLMVGLWVVAATVSRNARKGVAGSIRSDEASSKEKDMETHAEHSKKAKVATPCAAQDITFGGRCLNCGYAPNKA